MIDFVAKGQFLTSFVESLEKIKYLCYYKFANNLIINQQKVTCFYFGKNAGLFHVAFVGNCEDCWRNQAAFFVRSFGCALFY